MSKNISKPDSNDELRNYDASRQPAAQNNDFAASFFAETFSRFQRIIGSTRDVDLANALGISQQSVYGAKSRQRIPDSWYSIIADKYGASSDWLRTGDGAMSRGDAADSPSHTEPAPNDHKYGNEPRRRDISIADALAKTAKVLESDTVYREALYSNIEAFHHGVTMDERLSRMDSKFDQVMSRLDALEAENAQLRHELEQSRAESAVQNTG